MDKVLIKMMQNDKETIYKVSSKQTLLAALYEIKETQNASLTFNAGCRASVCGTCAMRVNGREVLACAYKPKEGDFIEPLAYHTKVRDLKVDKRTTLDTLVKAKAWLHHYNETTQLTPKDEYLTERQSDCIMCESCYSACPVFAVNSSFIGPFALTRAYRYVEDRREKSTTYIIDAIQNNGVWDCTLCGECTIACPKGIDPKNDIVMLRTKSVQQGYSDPNFSFGFGTPDFGRDFGFDPSTG
ncbi:MAG: 4Fe-4S dicluster domain-containing protein [Sulfurovum sp.]|nr:4Fe-4S dicluster domain-containing protein [Sulfurovum sp.]